MGLLNNPDIQEKLAGMKDKIGDSLRTKLIEHTVGEFINQKYSFVDNTGKKKLVTSKDAHLVRAFLQTRTTIKHGKKESSYDIIVQDDQGAIVFQGTVTVTIERKPKAPDESTK